MLSDVAKASLENEPGLRRAFPGYSLTVTPEQPIEQDRVERGQMQQGQWCVVTGATSGIGTAVVAEMLRQGQRVAGIGRSAEALADLTRAWPGQFVGIVHDVSDGNLTQSLVEANIPLADIDLVVHSAGCARQGTTITDMSEDDIRTMIATNVLGTTLVIKDMATVLARRGKGTLVVLGSVAAHDTAPLMAVYAATKAYTEHLVRSVRADLLGSRVRLSCIQPGTTRTSLLDGQPGLTPAQRFAGFDPLEAQDVARTIGWIHSQPCHVNIQDMSLYPVDQCLYVRGVHRRLKD